MRPPASTMSENFKLSFSTYFLWLASVAGLTPYTMAPAS